jgi:DNA-3-methyladenine glycosylase II
MWRKAERFLLKDKFLSPLVKKWGHCDISPRKESDYFSGLVREIISQQLSGVSASAIRTRFEKKVKGKITPKNILKLSEQNLRDCGMAWSKARYVRDLAQKVKDGVVKIGKLDKLPDGEVMRELIQVKGIGRWTAEMFLMFSLARPDIFPVDDLGIRKGFQKVVGRKLEGEKLARFAEKHWKPFRTVASWYLWQNLDNR